MSEHKRILIVDDDEQNRDLLSAMIEALGYDSEEARDGIEALARLNPDIDLVLLDIMMPQIDGFEVAQRIRKIPEYGDVPVIMVTSLNSKADRLRAVESGANDFISKPVDRIELQVRMNSLLKAKEAHDAIKRHKVELEVVVEQRTAQLRESEALTRKLYEEARIRLRFYRHLLDSSSDALVILDKEGKPKFVSQAFTRMFGWTLEELEGRRIPFVPDSERDATIDLIEKVIWDGITVRGVETKRRTRDGKTLDVVLNASRYQDPQGNTGGMLVIMNDITERKRIEEDLRRSQDNYRKLYEESKRDEEFYHSLLNASPDPIVVYDMLGMPTYVNPAFTLLFGWTFGDLESRNVEFIPPDKWTEAKEMTRKVLNCEDFHNIVTRRLNKEGEAIDVSVSGSPFLDQNGQTAGCVIHLRRTSELSGSSNPPKEDES
jgi:PAS domain S-box-containing protein